MPLSSLALPVPAMAGVADDAARAADDLAAAVDALGAASGGQDQITALTQTIRAYEAGLAALREALRQSQQREGDLLADFSAQQGQIAQLLAVLSRIEAEPAPTLLLHPSGPVGTVRAGMILAEVTPALQAKAQSLRTQLAELAQLRALQVSAGETLTRGLDAAQTARSTLAMAISDRTDLPRRFTENPDVLRDLLQSADTLDAFAAGLALNPDATAGFAAAKGRLDLPALGTVLLRPGEVDARGVARPGVTLSTRPAALVIAPWAATIRYRGPLLDYGNVMVIEPGDGYLLVIAGLSDVFGEVGEVLSKGAALGLMGGRADDSADLLAPTTAGGAGRETETLYFELRQGANSIDPTDWFAATAQGL
ncbi:MAG: peptidoglycan DD-metalloendopeptidase family protein [Cypionkella sp.]|nr:peptidoglycan DD-metalloendopeptidase family protein [Cypionkella sp.]